MQHKAAGQIRFFRRAEEMMKNRSVSGSYDAAARKRNTARKKIRRIVERSSLLSPKKSARRIVALCNGYGIPATEMRQMVREEILSAAAEIYGG